MKFKFANFNKDFDSTKVVTNPEDYDGKAFTKDGIFSEDIFGNYNSESEFTKGWIDFGDYYIINPVMFSFLKKVIPKLPKLIKTETSVDLEGNEVNNNEIDSVGLIELRENFDYYLEEYGDKDTDAWKLIEQNYDKLWINKFPIISSKLRPGILINKVITGPKVNSKYNFAIKYAKELKSSDGDIEGNIQINNLIYQLQIYCNSIMTDIINSFIKQKKGWLRGHILGSRINYSARNIIVPVVISGDMKINDIIMPYKTYLELYKKQIINLLVKSKGINYIKANYLWWKATLKFDPTIYKYMVELNKKTEGGQWILLNRNPTINIGSILLLRVYAINPNYEDEIFQLSNNILTSLNADFDGDVLNIIPLFNKHLVRAFQCFSPARLIINSNDGKFNPEFSLEKEEKAAFWILNNEL